MNKEKYEKLDKKYENKLLKKIIGDNKDNQYLYERYLELEQSKSMARINIIVVTIVSLISAVLSFWVPSLVLLVIFCFIEAVFSLLSYRISCLYELVIVNSAGDYARRENNRKLIEVLRDKLKEVVEKEGEEENESSNK